MNTLKEGTGSHAWTKKKSKTSSVQQMMVSRGSSSNAGACCEAWLKHDVS